MEWIILFIVSWVLFILLADWKKLKVNIWCGAAAIFCQMAADSMAGHHKLYYIENPVLHILGSSVFFGLGPVFVIATLLAQFHPSRKPLVILNIIILTALYSLQELLLLARHVLVYTNWHFTESLFLNLVVLAALSWFSITVLGKGRHRPLKEAAGGDEGVAPADERGDKQG